MADTTKIEWTDATWNPITGCTLVSEGCRYCYAARLAATRMKHHPSRKGLARINAAGEAKFTGEVRLNEQWLDQPLRWRKPRRIFVCAHGDLFHEAVPDEWIDRVFAVMALSRHQFQVLTKRPERAREYMNGNRYGVVNAAVEIISDARGDVAGVVQRENMDRSGEWPLPNVWLGTSVEDQATADARIPALLATPAAVRFVSCEPLLGPVDLLRWSGLEGDADFGLDWVIVGGESGPNARPMHPDWARSLRDQCQAAGVPFFFKQVGEWTAWQPASGPYWGNAYSGDEVDRHILLPTDMDADPTWDDGLAHYTPGETDHCAFQRVGKRAAGRLLDGQEWNQMPEGQADA
jgi:protein gp37